MIVFTSIKGEVIKDNVRVVRKVRAKTKVRKISPKSPRRKLINPLPVNKGRLLHDRSQRKLLKRKE